MADDPHQLYEPVEDPYQQPVRINIGGSLNSAYTERYATRLSAATPQASPFLPVIMIIHQMNTEYIFTELEHGDKNKPSRQNRSLLEVPLSVSHLSI